MSKPALHITAREAFALFLETACTEFETLQALISGELRLIGRAAPASPTAGPTIRMALAKSFLFNANRANRICIKNKSQLSFGREEREEFLRATRPLSDVRDVNEHGFDGDKRSEKNKPSMHEQDGGLLDETALVIAGPKNILMGPLNLQDIYIAVARARSIAGFSSLPHERP
ncbi:hypothetical protein ACNJYA_11230 [Bradyrhizobium sp. DASA03068]|uniref:hypothetical protein n=1 Tax=Bradyrhizobium sp. BLXBL-01 TaxID=3395915 RepID=UPI003F72A696